MSRDLSVADPVTLPDEDESLIAAFQGGDAEAFACLFRKYQGRFCATARRFLHDASEAEDVTQEAFMEIFQGLPRFRRQSTFHTWAYRILVRVCLAHRQMQHRQNSLPPLPPYSNSEETPLTHLVVEKAMAELPDAARMILILRYYQQLSLEEIAVVMRLNSGQTKMRLHRARTALKEVLLRQGEEVS